MRFNIILSDCPWTYNDKCHSGKRGAGYKYDLMSIEDIKALPVQNLSADNCVLFMWVTFPLLQEGLDTIKAWGFRYKTIGFNWIKTYPKAGTPCIGMGNWTRSNSELCLLATKGKPKRVSGAVSSVIIAPREEHSKKPDIVRDKIVQLCGDLPRIELFARQSAPGWKHFGNQAPDSYEDWLNG